MTVVLSGIPYYLRNGKSYGFQIWPVHSMGPSEQNPIKNFKEKGVWAYPGTAQFFRVPPGISGTGKAMNFKFCVHIYRLSWNKSPLKISGKVVMRVVRVSQNFSAHPLIGTSCSHLCDSSAILLFTGRDAAITVNSVKSLSSILADRTADRLSQQ